MLFGLDKSATLRLMVINDHAEHAEGLANHLRNLGSPVRMLRPGTLEECTSLIASIPAHDALDVVVVELNNSFAPLPQVLSLLRSKITSTENPSEKDKENPTASTALVVVVPQYDAAVVSQLLDQGVSQVVPSFDLNVLTKVVSKEWAVVSCRRSSRMWQKQLEDANKRCDALIESSRDPIAYIHEGMHIRANEAYLQAFGFEDFADIEGISVLDLVSSQNLPQFKALLKQLSKGEQTLQSIAVEAKSFSGQTFPATIEFAPATYEGEACLQVVVRKPKDNELSSEKMQELMSKDPVTNLLTRAAFIDEVEKIFAAQKPTALQSAGHVLLLVEPDHYQRLVQNVGLKSADQLLQSLSSRLTRIVEHTSLAKLATSSSAQLVSRLSDHQFAIFMSSPSYKASHEFAEFIRAGFAEKILDAAGHSVTLTVSIGGVHHSGATPDTNAVLSKALFLLRENEEHGGNKSSIFDPSAVDLAVQEKMMKNLDLIRTALDQSSFVVRYQPLIALHGAPVDLYELHTHVLGEDGRFIDGVRRLATEHGLIWEIDRWNVEHAITAIARHKNSNQTTMLVKINEASIQDDSLIQHITDLLARHQVKGNQLILELPEGKIGTHLKTAQTFRLKLSNVGVRVGLDQFGAAVDSMQLLSHFNADVIKLAPSLTIGMSESAEMQEKMRQLAEKIKAQGKEVVVEHVQDAQAMSLLFSAGIDYAQGDFLAPSQSKMDYEF